MAGLDVRGRRGEHTAVGGLGEVDVIFKHHWVILSHNATGFPCQVLILGIESSFCLKYRRGDVIELVACANQLQGAVLRQIL